MVSTGDTTIPASTSGVAVNGSGGGTGIDSVGTTAGSAGREVGEEQRLGDAGSAVTASTKPPFSYTELIAMAIEHSPHRRALLPQIHAYIASHFPYYGPDQKGWQMAIKNRLSSSKCFVKVPQEVDKRKGNYWTVDPQYEDLLKKGTFRLHRSVGVVTTPGVTHGPDSAYKSYLARCQQHHNASPSVRPQPVDVADGSPSEPSALRAAVDTGDGSIWDEDEGVGGGSLLPSTYTSFPGCDYGTAVPTSTSLSCSKVGSTGRATPDSSHPGDGRCEDDIAVSDGTTSPDDAAVLTSTSRGTDNGAGEEQRSSVAGSARTAKKRPLFSYTELSAMAIAQSPNRRARVSEIYAYIVKRFPYFKRKKRIRQKALSNNLSRNRCFINVPQKDSAGKGNYWMLDPKYEEKLENGEFRPRDMKQLLHRGLGVSVPVRREHSDRGLRQRQQTGLSEDARLPETGGGAAVPLPSGLPYTRNSDASTTSTGVSACEVGSTGHSAPGSSHPGAGRHANDILAADTTPSIVDVGTAISASDVTADSNGGGTGGSTGGAGGAGEERLLGDTDTTRTADDRPPYSYKVLIAMAIAQSPHRRSTMSEIYAYISNRYPYFRRKKKICQNSIRCILSSYKCFVKVPPESGDRNGAYRNYWMLDPQHGDMLENRKCRSRNVKRSFRRGSAASVPLRHSQLRHHSRRPHQPQHHSGVSEQPQLLETGGSTVPLPTYPHYARSTQISDENDSASVEESNLQNVTHDEFVMPQEVSTHFGSYCVPAQGITTQEDNFLCSTDNTDPLADNQLIICDPRSIKKEVFEECVPEFSDCNEEDPDVYLGVDSTEIEEADTRGHTSDMTRNSKATTASSSLSVSDVGCTGRATPGSSHWDNTTPASDVTASPRDASTPTSASGVTADSSSSGANTGSGGATAGSASVGAGEQQLFGDGGSASSASTEPSPFFYTRLIAMAVRQSPHRKVTLSEIFAYISSHFPYLEQEKESWQKSIRVSLSFSKYFVEVPREDGDREDGSCNYWTLDPQCEDVLENDKFHYCHEKWPFCRGPTAVEAEGGGGTPLLSAHPQHTSTAAATSPGGGHCEDDIVVSDTMTLSGDAATVTSTSGDSGIDGTSNGTGGATVGSSGNGTEELQLSGDSSSATTSDRKPPFSYEELTAMAIMKSPHRRATVAEIVTYIASRFPFFKRSEKSWQSSIQCKLYFSKYFLKVRLEGRNYKGKRFNYWMLDPQYGNTFDDGNFFRRQCVEQPPSRSRGPEAADVAVGNGAALSPDYPHCTRYEHSTATATSAILSASEIDSADRAAPDSSHPGGTFREDDIPASDVKTSTDGAATLNSPCGGIGNGRRGSSVGSSANGVGEERPSSDTGSASIARSKPPFQYEELIAMAIMKSPHRRATLSEINAYIASCFPYFDRNKKSWQSSIHCKLCFSKYFIKVPLEGRNYKGKCFNYWMLDPQYEDMFERGNFCQRQHAKQPSSRSRGCEGADVSIGGGGVSSSGGPHCASYEHSTATTTSATVVISDVYGTVRPAADSFLLGGGHPEDDIPVSDTVTSTGGAAVLTSTAADTGNSRIDDTGDNGDADGVEGEQPSGDAGSAGTVDRKPPFRYEELIAMAILKSSRRRATLKEINTYIASRFPYFKRSEKSWQSSVQCKLYFSKYFLKVPLAVRNRRGKRCNLWMLDFNNGNLTLAA
ncbi:uncharacterized protein LOC126108831 [Schistocerca cancellata]|uniref:uncharacterized protein LOC126108831 n=1 Tax=Schistocerca cancellata TaxID=274614 RepID=UPI0021189863|nr:uncharacterized protein LOC126108831 [Schistocerca cancellata]